MEAAVNELRVAIQQALSIDIHNDQEDQWANSEAQVESSESTYISSLSGSLPSDRSGTAAASTRRKLFTDSNRNGNADRHGWQSRLELARNVENAVSNYEMTLLVSCSEEVPSWIGIPSEIPYLAFQDAINEGDVADLLLATMSAVPRNLLRQNHLPMWRSDSDAGESSREGHLKTIEHICFSAACISSDILVKLICQHGNRGNQRNKNNQFLESHRVQELIDEVISVCEASPTQSGWHLLFPVIKVLNALSESTQSEFAKNNRDEYSVDEMNHVQVQVFKQLSTKETLRLAQILIKRFLHLSSAPSLPHVSPEKSEQFMEEMSSQVGLFINSLLDHFFKKAEIDVGQDSFEDCQLGLFEAWSDGTDEHMVRRLNDHDAGEIPNLFAQYHIGSIRSASQLIENSGELVGSFMVEYDNNEELDENDIVDVLLAVQETLRHVAVAVSVTEILEKLGMAQKSDVYLALQPMMVSYAKFIASYFHDALLLIRTVCAGQDCEGICKLSDELLLRLCQTSTRLEFLKHNGENDDQREVLAISLLRAINSHCTLENSQPLIDMAIEQARNYKNDNSSAHESRSKRTRLESHRKVVNGPRICCADYLSNSNDDLSSHETRRDFIDMLLACVALLHSNQFDGDESQFDKISYIASSLLVDSPEEEESNDITEVAILDSLNPWHTLQVKSVQKIRSDLEQSTNDVAENNGDSSGNSILPYLSIPTFFDTSSSIISL